MAHVWGVVQKRKAKQQQRQEEKKQRLEQAFRGDDDAVVQGGGDPDEGVDATRGENDYDLSEVSDDWIPEMPENWVPPHLLVYILWGPLSPNPEEEFHLTASSGPETKKRRSTTTGTGSNSDDSGLNALESPSVMQKLNEDGGMLSRRQMQKAKKEKSGETQTRIEEHAQHRARATTAMETSVEQATIMCANVGRIAQVREHDLKVDNLERQIQLLEKLGRSGQAAIKAEQLLELLGGSPAPDATSIDSGSSELSAKLALASTQADVDVGESTFDLTSPIRD